MIKNISKLDTKSLLFLMALWSYALFALPIGAITSLVILLFTYFLYCKGKIFIRITLFHKYLVVFVVFCFLSSLWAIDSSVAFLQGEALLKNLIIIFSLYMVFDTYKDVTPILDIILVGGYIIVVYLFFKYGVDDLFLLLKNASRIDNDVINANILGMSLAYSGIVLVYYGAYYGWKIWHLLFFINVSIVIISASKKGILILLMGSCAVLVLKNWKNRFRDIFKIILLIILLALAISFLIKLPIFNGLYIRFQKFLAGITGKGRGDISTISRLQYQSLGISIWKEHPILGVGIDNAQIINGHINGDYTFLHNNYVELLADIGIVGFGLFYSIYVYLLYQFYKLRIYRDAEYDVCLIILAMDFVMGFAYVSYGERSAFFIIMLAFFKVMQIKEKHKMRGKDESKKVYL